MARITPLSKRDEKLAHVAKQIADLDIAMLTTLGESGRLVSRPLSTQHARLDAGFIRFFTLRSSGKIDELKADSRVNLAYASKEKNTYLSVAGRGRTNDDPSVKDALWNDALKAFFPKGKKDPDLTVLEVEVETVEIWDGPSSWIGKAVGFLIARVTGDSSALGDQTSVMVSKASVKKVPAKKASAKKTTVKKTASKKAPVKKKSVTATKGAKK